jgi:hypothetical protein
MLLSLVEAPIAELCLAYRLWDCPIHREIASFFVVHRLMSKAFRPKPGD